MVHVGTTGLSYHSDTQVPLLLFAALFTRSYANVAMELRRRRFLQATTALSVAALAGCSALSDSASTPTPTPSYDYLTNTPIYRSDDVGLRLPDRVPTVEAPTNADLIVVHGNPAVDAEQAVTWLAADRAVALLGDSAQNTWTEWTQSDAYRETFQSNGRSEATPEPHLLVAAAAETTAATYRYSWSDLPSNPQLLDSLDDAMADIKA